MALTATFAADFDQFTKSLSEAQTKLQVFDRATKTAAKSLNRELDSISGQKVAVEAARMAEAVKRLGGEGGTAAGLLKLTDDELKRLSATMDAAAAKAGKLGEKLPASLAQIRTELAAMGAGGGQANGVLGTLTKTLGVLGPLLPVASAGAAAAALVRFGSATVEAAGHVQDLADKLNVSAQFIQEMQEVANQTGSSIETFTQAAFKLGVNIADGSDKAKEAVKRLGLSYEELKRQSPEEQFRQVVKALEQVDNAQERNALGVALFGKQYSEMAGAVNQGMSKIAENTVKMTDAQVAALDRLGDAWTHYKDKALASAGAVLAGVVQAWEDTMASLTLPNLDTFNGADQAKILDALGKGGEGLAQVLRDVAKARKTDIELTVQGTQAQRDYVKALAEIDAKLKALSSDQIKQLNAAIALGSDDAKAYAESIGIGEAGLERYKDKAREAAASTKKLSEAWAESIVTGDGFEQALHWMDRLADASQELELRGTKALKELFDFQPDAGMAGFDRILKMRDNLARDIDKLTMNSTDFQIKEVERWEHEQLQSIDHAEEGWQELEAAIKKVAALRIGNIIDDDVVSNMERVTQQLIDDANRTRDAWLGAFDQVVSGVNQLANGFARLGQIAGDGVGKIAEAVGFAANILGDVQGILKARDAIGLLIASIRLATDLMVKLWDTFTESKGEKAGKEIARDFGIAFNEELGNQIAKTADDLFKGDRFTASIFSLDKIINDAGGLSSENLDKMTARLRDVFVLLQRGSLSSAQAVEVLNKNWQAFVDAGTDAAGRLTPALKEIIQLYRDAGIESQALSKYIQDQASKAIAGFNAVMGATKQAQASWAAYGEAVRKAQESGDQDALTAALTAQHKAAEDAKQELDDLGIQALASFNAAIAAGTDYYTALQQIQPGLQQLIKAHKDLGINMDNVALKALAVQSAMLDHAPELLQGVAGLTQEMVALDNIGMLNADTFAAMERTGAEMYTRLQAEAAAAGGTTKDALMPMQGFLHEAVKQAELLGVPLDENTQRMIDQSKELGIWKEGAADMTTVLMDGLGAIIEALGGELPASFQKARDAADKTKDKVGKTTDDSKDGFDNVGGAIVDMTDDLDDFLRKLHQIPATIGTTVKTTYENDGGGTGSGSGGGDSGDGGSSNRNISATLAARRANESALSASVAKGALDRGYTIHVPVNLDGRQVALVTAKHLPGAITRLGGRSSVWP